MNAFTTLRSEHLTSNSFGQNQNCYYCTIAALLGVTTSELVSVSETMMQDCAKESEIIELMNNAKIPGPVAIRVQNLGQLTNLMSTLQNGSGVGLAYTRINGTGHMIVAARYPDGRGVCVDYQTSPPTITPDFPEPWNTILSCIIFCRS